MGEAGIVFIVLFFIFFLVGRELVCWYFKINRRVELLENILTELKSKNEKSNLNMQK